jgi:hypothetical protein
VYTLRREEDEVTVLPCPAGDCVAWLPRGKYLVHVSATDDYAGGERRVNLTQDSTLRVQPRNASDGSVGLGMGIGGVVLFFGGISLLIAASERNCRDVSCDSQEDFIVLGLAGLIGGAILTPLGWVKYGKSFRPAVEVQNDEPAAR